jgi:MoxR-like ATPase
VHETIEHESGTDVEKVQSMIKQQSDSNMQSVADMIAKQVLREPVKIEVKTSTETIKVDGIHHEKSPDVLKALYRGDRVMLVGGAGSGKTFMAQQMHKALAKMLDQADYAFGMSGAMHQAYEVRGYMDANGNYVESSFVKCFRDGGLFLFDEIDGSNPQALVALNASLENEFSDFPCGVVKRHPNFRMIACANTYGRGADREYVGRNQLDGATLDRFKPIVDFDYDLSLEQAVTPNAKFTKVVQTLRKAKDDMRIRHIISMRASVAGGKAINDGVSFDEVIENYVLSGLDDDTRKRIINEAGGVNVLKRLNKTGITMTDEDALAKAKEEIRNEEGSA